MLEHSPLLIDADLVDIVATGNSDMQCAIARRINLPSSVSAAIAEVGSAAAALELIENAYAELAPFSWDRIVERHGHLAAIREAMLCWKTSGRHPPGAGRETVRDAGAVRCRAQLAERRTGGAARGRSRANARPSASRRDPRQDMQGLVRHLRATGQFNAGLILRALLSGNLDCSRAALAELAGLPLARVTALVHDRGSASLRRC